MTELVLEPRSSLYFGRRRNLSCWHLKAKNYPPGFEFPPWVEIKGLWRKVAPGKGELMCRHGYQGHLVFTVQTGSMKGVRQKFMAGVNQLIDEMENTHV